MTRSDPVTARGDIHPIDIVEAVAAHRAWTFDRLARDQIVMDVHGLWRHYAPTLAWSPDDAVLRLVCSFDLDPPADRMPEIYETINLANDRVWDGGFTFWAAQRQMVWRYGLVLAGEARAVPEQIDRMIGNAVAACERFYPSFQLAGRGQAAPEAALAVAFGPTRGRA